MLVREGLFLDTDPPVLLGSRCTHCGSVLFPRADVCTYCASEDPEQIELSRRGTLWAWTAVTAPPPGYLGSVPYGIGVVELPEGVRVIGAPDRARAVRARGRSADGAPHRGAGSHTR